MSGYQRGTADDDPRGCAGPAVRDRRRSAAREVRLREYGPRVAAEEHSLRLFRIAAGCWWRLWASPRWRWHSPTGAPASTRTIWTAARSPSRRSAKRRCWPRWSRTAACRRSRSGCPTTRRSWSRGTRSADTAARCAQPAWIPTGTRSSATWPTPTWWRCWPVPPLTMPTWWALRCVRGCTRTGRSATTAPVGPSRCGAA